MKYKRVYVLSMKHTNERSRFAERRRTECPAKIFESRVEQHDHWKFRRWLRNFSSFSFFAGLLSPISNFA